MGGGGRRAKLPPHKEKRPGKCTHCILCTLLVTPLPQINYPLVISPRFNTPPRPFWSFPPYSTNFSPDHFPARHFPPGHFPPRPLAPGSNSLSLPVSGLHEKRAVIPPALVPIPAGRTDALEKNRNKIFKKQLKFEALVKYFVSIKKRIQYTKWVKHQNKAKRAMCTKSL